MEETNLNLVAAMLQLQDLSVYKIQVDYSGGGDSGSIEDISFLNKDGNDVSVNSEIKQLIEDLSYKKLNEIEDWWNNDGGWGMIVIDVPSCEYTIENHIRITDYEVYNHEGSLKDEE
jgi:hypothetical protein